MAEETAWRLSDPYTFLEVNAGIGVGSFRQYGWLIRTDFQVVEDAKGF